MQTLKYMFQPFANIDIFGRWYALYRGSLPIGMCDYCSVKKPPITFEPLFKTQRRTLLGYKAVWI